MQIFCVKYLMISNLSLNLNKLLLTVNPSMKLLLIVNSSIKKSKQVQGVSKWDKFKHKFQFQTFKEIEDSFTKASRA